VSVSKTISPLDVVEKEFPWSGHIGCPSLGFIVFTIYTVGLLVSLYSISISTTSWGMSNSWGW